MPPPSPAGLKVGLEIHQQLETGKLFCSCPCELSEDVRGEFLRTLKVTRSELGEVDQAAMEAASRGLRFRYQLTPGTCLVEADEEPPHEANPRAIAAALEMALFCGMTPVDEIHFMRKIVIDGSNTGGFQRSALIATGGSIQVGEKTLPLTTLCLEEDSARKIAQHGAEITYRLDRLGIPLIEIATGPEISSPEEARAAAERLGALLRATGKVKRGLGTIREDLNISVPGGARIEIKGVQDLRLLPAYIAEEARRQTSLLRVRDELKRRGVTKVEPEIVRATPCFPKTSCKVIASALKARGGVFGVRLLGFAGLLGPGPDGHRQLGAEFAGRARFAGVRGIFHSDELPGYGITAEETEAVRTALALGTQDAFVLVAEQKEAAIAALDRIVERAKEALVGVPEETRDPLPDGTTAYSRPLPGRARMYPETDVPPIRVDAALLTTIRSSLPELPEAKLARFVEQHALSQAQAKALLTAGYEAEFEWLVGRFGNPSLVARLFLQTYAELEKEKLLPENLTHGQLEEAFSGLAEGLYAKEALGPVLGKMLRSGLSARDAAGKLGLFGGADDVTIAAVVDRIVREREAFVRERGVASIGPLMGLVMAELRGKADGKRINELLTARIRALLR